MKLLLAEDDQNIAKIAKFTLETLGGHKVIHVPDGQQALDSALNNQFDGLLLDEMMPKLNGLKVSQLYIKSNPSHLCPIIFLSAKNQKQDIDDFLKWGQGHIQKPFEPKMLVSQVEQIIQKAQQCLR